MFDRADEAGRRMQGHAAVAEVRVRAGCGVGVLFARGLDDRVPGFSGMTKARDPGYAFRGTV